MLVIVMGIIGELFVPTLPLGVPQRGFGVYSLLALFQVCDLKVILEEITLPFDI